ncbi:hypothetical protein LTS15_000008 [Exophiala xenobiotica]|nr:hypothetical protein LTS15_000008 [Exophiala xenobiotica]
MKSGAIYLDVKMRQAALWSTGHQPQGQVVCAAHTNEAVRVACERTAQLASEKFDMKPEETICLVLPRAKSGYFRLSDKEFGSMENLTLEAHMERIARAQSVRYHRFLEGLNHLQRYGRISDMSVRTGYNKDYELLAKAVRAKCRISFSTLATIHDKDGLFGRHAVTCSLFIVDEASQASEPAIFQAWLALDPSRVVMSGDHKQLKVFTASEISRSIWGVTAFEKLINRGCPQVVLDVQYRTVRTSTEAPIFTTTT